MGKVRMVLMVLMRVVLTMMRMTPRVEELA